MAISSNFVLLLFNNIRREKSQIEQHLEVKVEDGREMPWKPTRCPTSYYIVNQSKLRFSEVIIKFKKNESCSKIE